MVFKMRKLIILALFIPFSLFSQIGYFEPWGKDADLKLQNPKKKEKKITLLTKVADKIITFHQKVLSPTDGPRSHFRPTSSRYMQLAMYRYGFFKGFIMGCDRLLRENNDPWVYRKIVINNVEYKYDPASNKKYITSN